MRLRRFLLRYYPPGITLEYEHSSGTPDCKTIDLLTLAPEYVPLHACKSQLNCNERMTFGRLHSKI